MYFLCNLVKFTLIEIQSSPSVTKHLFLNIILSDKLVFFTFLLKEFFL